MTAGRGLNDTKGLKMPTTGSQFGLSEETWQSIKAEARAAIVDAARDGRLTSYGEVAGSVTAVALDPHSTLMSNVLGAIFEDEHRAGRPALTAIVTHKYGDKEPGTAFYKIARRLGYRFTEPYVFWAQQVQAVFESQGRSRTSPRA